MGSGDIQLEAAVWLRNHESNIGMRTWLAEHFCTNLLADDISAPWLVGGGGLVAISKSQILWNWRKKI